MPLSWLLPIDDRCYTILKTFLQILASVNWSADNPKHQSASPLWATLQVVDGSNLNTSFMLQIVVHPIYHGINSWTKGILSQHTISPSKCREKDLIGNHRELFLLHSNVAAEQRRWKWGRSQEINRFTVTIFARPPWQSSTTSVCCRALACFTNRCSQLWWSIQHRCKML